MENRANTMENAAMPREVALNRPERKNRTRPNRKSGWQRTKERRARENEKKELEDNAKKAIGTPTRALPPFGDSILRPVGDISSAGYNTSGAGSGFLGGIPSSAINSAAPISRGSRMGSQFPNAMQEQMREPWRRDQWFDKSSNLYQQHPTSSNAPGFGTGLRDTDDDLFRSYDDRTNAMQEQMREPWRPWFDSGSNFYQQNRTSANAPGFGTGLQDTDSLMRARRGMLDGSNLYHQQNPSSANAPGFGTGLRDPDSPIRAGRGMLDGSDLYHQQNPTSANAPGFGTGPRDTDSPIRARNAITSTFPVNEIRQVASSQAPTSILSQAPYSAVTTLAGTPSLSAATGSEDPNAMQEQMREPWRRDQELGESSNLYQKNPTFANAPGFGTGPRDTDSPIRARNAITSTFPVNETRQVASSQAPTSILSQAPYSAATTLAGTPSMSAATGSEDPNAMQEQMREAWRQDQELGESSDLYQKNPTSANAPGFGTDLRDTDSPVCAGRGMLDDDLFSNRDDQNRNAITSTFPSTFTANKTSQVASSQAPTSNLYFFVPLD